MAEVSVSVQVSGNLEQVLMAAMDKVVAAAKPALIEEAIMIQGASMEIVPVDQGVLRASALEVGVDVQETATSVDVRIGYGGAAASYALLQHETPPEIFSHAPGRSWKYLEQPSYAAVDGMGQRIAARLSAAITGADGGGGTFE